jgi:hypothetical protein
MVSPGTPPARAKVEAKAAPEQAEEIRRVPDNLGENEEVTALLHETLL